MTDTIKQPKARWGRLVSIDDASEYLGISPTTFRGLELSSVRIGRRVLYDIRQLDRFVDGLSGQHRVARLPTADRAKAMAEEERLFFERRAKRPSGSDQRR